MQPTTGSKLPNKKKSASPFSYRPAVALAPRFNNVVAVSRRTRASVLHEALELHLPELERRYAAQLKNVRGKSSAR